ncbi:MAG: dihydrodipicolinate reductase [Acidobacteria bacterium ACB1]|nr:4-hydroxy-tetrahydrodipicolinate reductase [Pyrinomonadaceae bacterium]MCE7963346.1 dihydrodipicolinate reductase [Acidobacteria bacterium ACB1]RIJ95817.1 MAG: dihydrodipicolinate reductase [Acidobacteriota bacterium]
MKIALIGYGAMGKIVERLAVEKGHEIAGVIDESGSSLSAAELADKLRGADVAIDFSVAEAVGRNVEACVAAEVPLVEGTTGWQDRRTAIEQVVREGNGAIIFGANFSIGVNLFYRIADFTAELFSKFPEYEAFIEERHHSRKKDAPSGTALKLKEVVSRHIERDFTVAATRAGNIPGTHTVGFDGPADQITLTHTARTREGFASGSILAAEWIVGKKGVYEFTEIIDQLVAK